MYEEYIDLVVMFEKWVEKQNISSNGVLLWRTLISAISNEVTAEFSLPLRLLEQRTKLHKSTICRAREELVLLGLIDYNRGSGNQSASYRMIPIALHNATQMRDEKQFELHTATQITYEKPIELHSATQRNSQHSDNTEVNSKIQLSPQVPIYINTSIVSIDKVNKENIRYGKFTVWLEANAMNVVKMREPFTQSQYEKLFLEFPRDEILETLLAMHNYAELHKRNVSAYLTARNWLRRRLRSPDTPLRQGKVDKMLSILKQIENEQNDNQ